MNFEFDEAKSKSNKAKHGIDFVEAQELWEDENRIIIPSANNGTDEQRNILLGKIDKVYAAVFTMREEVTRLISVRHARKNEKEFYNDNEDE